MINKIRTRWLNVGPFPIYLGFCPSEKAWLRTFRRLKIKLKEPYPTADGHCLLLTNVKNGKEVILITLAESSKNRDPQELMGLIVHEIMHAWRFIRESIHEDSPSSEFEAYMMQSMVQQCVGAFEQTRHNILTTKTKRKSK